MIEKEEISTSCGNRGTSCDDPEHAAERFLGMSFSPGSESYRKHLEVYRSNLHQEIESYLTNIQRDGFTSLFMTQAFNGHRP